MKNKYYIAKLDTGYVVIRDYQYFKGYTLFLCKNHVEELHFLEEEFRNKFINELSIVGQAVYNAYPQFFLKYPGH